MLEARELKKLFTKIESKKKRVDFYAVDGISLTLKEGEILGVLGPNGAGKTTLLRMLGQIMMPTEGSVLLTDKEGRELTDSVEKKQNIGYLSENTKLYHRFSAREMLTTWGELYGMDREAVERRITEIAELLGMQDFMDNRIKALSTGQTQRASIARCLVHDPQYYIFDEPTLGLDIISSKSIIDFMKKEKERGKSVLYSTHYMEEAEFLCDRIVMIHKGRVLEEGTPTQLKEKTGTSNLRETFLSLIGGAVDDLA